MLPHKQPYACDHDGCGKTFAHVGPFEAHKRTHTGDRPYACDHDGCGKRFTQAGHLTVHKHTHTGKQPYACDHEGCGKRFARADHLTWCTSTRTRASSRTPVTTMAAASALRGQTTSRGTSARTRAYACDHEGCGKRFSQSGSLTTHNLGSLTTHKKRAHTLPLLCVQCWVPC
jgi:uncharacterized Zn-finger protein